jgi:hypothetical protein
MTRRLFFLVPVLVLLAGLGCGANLTPQERRYQAVYERVLTPVQLERYRGLRSSAEREAFIEVMALGEELRALDPKAEGAVLSGEIFPGMNERVVLLAWGLPFSRIARAEGGSLKEVWIYPRRPDPASGKEVGPRYAYFEDGVLIRTRDDSAQPEPFDPLALVLMPFGELVKLIFGVATLPLAPFAR